jgi:glycosyltransferase involved in cell wall biosynthesis
MSNRVLVLSEDPVGGEMGGNAIRAFELAKVLRSNAEVTLAAPSSGPADDAVERVPFERDDPRALRALLRGIDVVVCLPQNPVVTAALRRSGARIVYDLYDPKPLQLLEARSSAGGLTQRYWSRIALDHVMGALSAGDRLICASERQRDLWIGAMLGAGLITPALYRDDPTLRGLIDVVPFGVPDLPPRAGQAGPRERFAALEASNEIVLWNGGLWNWLDPVCAVDAIAQVVEVRPQARLVFMGRAPQHARERIAAVAARTRAEQLGLLERVVFFNDGWVPYQRRASWLLAADCALSLHVEHLETRFAFRTRLLDCFWSGLPVVCTEGDELAERVERDHLGVSIASQDPHSAAAAILEVLEKGRDAYREPLARAAADYRWPVAAAPLAAYVAELGDQRGRRSSRAASPGRWSRALLTRAVRVALRGLGSLR